MRLKRSSDRKTANSATAGGNVRIKNAFGLLSGRDNSCPGQTSVCESVCYAGRMENQYPNVRKVMTDNWEFCRDATPGDLIVELNTMIRQFVNDCNKWDAPKEFRIHHDGDFFSVAYAEAWNVVIHNNPDVQFWAYTRSFHGEVNVVHILANLPNLTLYISVDADNEQYAEAILSEYPDVKAATLTDTADAGKVMIGNIGRSRPGGACPEVMGRIPLITPAGGACQSCQLCIVGKSDIRFSISGK
jgi:Gene product 88